jgi:DNA-directed RNA polymerase subunit RPC12/RpoP
MDDERKPIRMYECAECAIKMPATTEFFYEDHSINGGLSLRCKACHDEWLLNPQKEQVVSKTEKQKTCIKCGKMFPATLDFFGIRPKRKKQLGDRCIECEEEWQITLGELKKTRICSACKQRLPNTKDNFINGGSSSKLVAMCKKCISKYIGGYIKAHPQHSVASNARRRARKRNAEGSFSSEDVLLMKKSQGNRCWYCQKSLEAGYHIEHRVPLSRGGSNNPSNLVLACPSCNLSKGDKLPSEWSDRLL